MTRRIVIVQLERAGQVLEVPARLAAGAWLNDLLRAWPAPPLEGGYALHAESGPLDLRRSLVEHGVENGDCLWLRPADDGSAPAAPVEIAPVAPAGWVLEQAALVSPAGLVYWLGSGLTTLGRSSPAGRPDIDLGELETRLGCQAASRQHARVAAADGGHWLEALPATNGTFVNQVEMPAGTRRRLETGDVIQFGWQGAALTYFARGARLPEEFFR